MVLPNFNSVDELLHYASLNYDPQKAHEYYLRTRQLTGRHSIKGFTQKQREGLAYAKDQIHQTEKTQVQNARNTEHQSIAAARAQAQAVRAEIAARLREFVDSLNKQHSTNVQNINQTAQQRRQAIDDKLATDLAAIPLVPRNLPKAQRDKLLAERATKIKALRDKASTDKTSVNSDIANTRASEKASVQDARKTNSDSIAATKAQVAEQLRQVVAKYAEDYKASKSKITSESAATLDQAYTHIKTKVR